MRRLPWDKTETRRQKLEGGKTPTSPFCFLLSALISLCLCGEGFRLGTKTIRTGQQGVT